MTRFARLSAVALMTLLAVPLARAQDTTGETGNAPEAKPGHNRDQRGDRGGEGLMRVIQRQDDRWAKAFNAGDAAAVAGFYAEDATVLPPGAAAVHGRAAIQSFWQDEIKHGAKNVAVTADSVDHYGRAAREIGHFTLDAPDAQQQTAHLQGKYVVIWKRQEGAGWQLDTDIWNLDK